MPDLWEAPRHEPICDSVWDESIARAAIREIAEDAERSYSPDTLWPDHPQDDAKTVAPRTSFYWGASGVAWALDQLRGRGAIETARDWIAEAARFVDLHLASPEIGVSVPALMLGEVGIRMIAGVGHDRIYELIESNIENPSLEMLWGAPGTMLPALLLYEQTGDARWRELYLRNAAFLIEHWEHHDDFDVWMWTQHLYGEVVRLLGAGHGFAGNALALLRGLDLLSDDQRDLVIERATHTLAVTALRDGALINWAPHVGTGRAGRDAMLVQWCHGAPGMILGLQLLPRSEQVDALLTGGAELTWQAGPLEKGPGLCHGTAGNGYAFLVLFQRTGDPLWLDRARRFAMHALDQTRAAREQYGRGRYSLWTGDPGVALFVQDCLDGDRCGLPLLDYC